MGLADRIVVMEAGAIRQVGTPGEVYDTPSDLFVANFVGSPGMNFIPGEVKAADGKTTFVPKDCACAIPLSKSAEAGSATLGIRPEFVSVDANGPVEGSVVMDEYQGCSSNLHVDAPFGRVIARSTGERRAPGDRVRLAFADEQMRVFDAQSGKRVV